VIGVYRVIIHIHLGQYGEQIAEFQHFTDITIHGILIIMITVFVIMAFLGITHTTMIVIHMIGTGIPLEYIGMVGAHLCIHRAITLYILKQHHRIHQEPGA